MNIEYDEDAPSSPSTRRRTVVQCTTLVLAVRYTHFRALWPWIRGVFFLRKFLGDFSTAVF